MAQGHNLMLLFRIVLPLKFYNYFITYAIIALHSSHIFNTFKSCMAMTVWSEGSSRFSIVLYTALYWDLPFKMYGWQQKGQFNLSGIYWWRQNWFIQNSVKMAPNQLSFFCYSCCMWPRVVIEGNNFVISSTLPLPSKN